MIISQDHRLWLGGRALLGRLVASRDKAIGYSGDGQKRCETVGGWRIIGGVCRVILEHLDSIVLRIEYLEMRQSFFTGWVSA